MHLMALGMYLFEIPSLAYDQLKRKTDWQHASTGRIGARDATQFVGPGPETISLSGSAYAEIADGRAEIDTLRDMADQGEAWPLVDGTGTVFGDYVITAIDEGHSYVIEGGVPLRIDFGIELLRVGDPVEAENKEIAKDKSKENTKESAA